MNKFDIQEAAPLLARTMRAVLAVVPTGPGRAGSDVRRSVGDLLAHSPQLLRDDEAGEHMAECFENARLAGVTLEKFGRIIGTTMAETPTTPGGILTRHCLILFELSTASHVISDMTFASRQDVQRVRETMAALFSSAEEVAADAMDSLTYRFLVELQAAVVSHLVETARPLPRLIRFHFARPLATLVASYRLYDDANRADELRAENKVVHPAFMRQDGLAMSA